MGRTVVTDAAPDLPNSDSNALWVALSGYGEGNIFHVYPKLLTELLMQEEAARVKGDTSEAEKLVLPSDKEWRLQQYFMLVAMQRSIADIYQQVFGTSFRSEDAESPEAKSSIEPSEDSSLEWAPWNMVVQYQNPNAPPPVDVKAPPGPAWDIGQVLKAGRLLFKPPIKVDFVDEQEMRCVYALIYDVFRYKSILDQAITDVEYFAQYPQFTEYRHTVWLFLMELSRRKWGARPRSEVEKAKQLLEEAGSPFKEVEDAVWLQRVHFAAAIARIRIKNKAFSLSELLPPHLRDDKVSACVHKKTVTGWVNTFKAKKVASLVKRLHELGYSYSNSSLLCAGEYRFDRVCPRFITLRPPEDMNICQLDLVKDGVIVLQEREFCEGASTLCRAIRANSLRGVVAQTHASSPRCSAYLAAQLRELAAVLKASTPAAPATPQLGKLVVFGAGDKVESYVCALRELGVEASEAPQSNAPVCVISDPVHLETPMVIDALDGVVAVLATPPNSYSSVTDPIDLVCGRGGDLAMLEILTESEINGDGKSRVQTILEEQKKTLKTLMSKPQIQLILYETHSALEAENQAQVTRAVAEANRLARERHALLTRKTDSNAACTTKVNLQDIGEIVSDTSITNSMDIDKVEHMEIVGEDIRPCSASTFASNSTRPSSHNILKKQSTVDKGPRPATTKARPIPPIPEPTNETVRSQSQLKSGISDIYVPSCDLFEVTNLPILGNGLDINYILDRDGCYLGLIQRKEITCLDAKYMIKVAEERGLFGGNSAGNVPVRRKKLEPTSASLRRRRRKTGGFEVERVAAPTYASLVRSRRGSAPAPHAAAATDTCERHTRHQAAAATYIGTCTCDLRHRQQIRQRRGSSEMPRPPEPQYPQHPQHPPACRRPFPMVVHDVRLHTVTLTHQAPHANKVII